MKVEGSRKDGVLHLRLRGGDALDSRCASTVKSEALARIDGSADVVVDLSAVEFVDSAGVGVLVGLFKAARTAGRRIRYEGVRPGVRSVLEIIRLDRIFDLGGPPPAASG